MIIARGLSRVSTILGDGEAMEQIGFTIIITVMVVILSRLFGREKREYGFPEVRKRGKKRR
jgi:hypothetical protein